MSQLRHGGGAYVGVAVGVRVLVGVRVGRRRRVEEGVAESVGTVSVGGTVVAVKVGV